MTDVDRKTKIALQLRLLGVSNDGIYRLLVDYPAEQIEAQLAYLPYRKAKRPEAMIIEAVRHSYAPPKDFFYAQTEDSISDTRQDLDEDSEPTS